MRAITSFNEIRCPPPILYVSSGAGRVIASIVPRTASST